MGILKAMFVIAIGTYVAYELTIRNKHLLPSSRKKQIEPGTNRNVAANI